MALYHFHAGIIKRSARQSVLAAAAYRAGECLFSDYYNEQADYTKKQGVVYKEILLPSHVPRHYADRETLWDEVEKVEEHPKAQLAYSYDIALQNELTAEENIALARRFLMEQFVSRGMICDFAVHAPDPKGGIPNPHFHVLCPIRPMNEDGTWGNKQQREYTLNKNGQRVRDEHGNYIWKSVPTTDWGQKETLLHWREEWARYVNDELEKKAAGVHIDHRSYKEQGIHQLPTIHEGPTVRVMEKKGIRTEKGNLNRMIRAANVLLKKLIARYQELAAWIKEAKTNLKEPVSPSLSLLLLEYLKKRNAGAYTDKAKANNLKRVSQDIVYLEKHGLSTLDDLQTITDQYREKVDTLNQKMRVSEKRQKELKELISAAERYRSTKEVVDGLKNIHFKMKRDQYRKEHEMDFNIHFGAKRILDQLMKDSQDKTLHLAQWKEEAERLSAEYSADYEELKKQREESKELFRIQAQIDSVLKEQERNQTQQAEQQKKNDRNIN